MDSWVSFKSALASCLNHGAIIYGGAVRDLMLHNIQAAAFSQEYDKSDYSDERVSPEAKDRLVVPHDIDCLIGGENSTRLIHHFNTQNFLKIEEVKNVYFNKEQNTNYQHIKLVVLFMRETLIYVKIDMIVQLVGELKMPYMNLDFDVNGLIMSTKGIRLNNCISTMGLNEGLNAITDASRLHRILENIRQKKAFTMDGCAVYRYKKMLGYGWDITFKSKIFRYYYEEDYDGNCIICKDNITGCSVNYKECKCDLRICLGCILKDYKKLDKCPLCAKICYTAANAIGDLLILKCKY